jgi:hypothetical protein
MEQVYRYGRPMRLEKHMDILSPETLAKIIGQHGGAMAGMLRIQEICLNR